MGFNDIPEDLTKFILTYLDSVEQVNVLLLLHSTQGRVWEVSEITQELRSSEISIEQRLKDLYTRELLSPAASASGRHQYIPKSEDLGTMIGQLADLYRVRPYRVIDLIYSRPPESLRAFSNAFKIKG